MADADFYEDDEPADAIRQIFEAERSVTKPPLPFGAVLIEAIPTASTATTTILLTP